MSSPLMGTFCPSANTTWSKRRPRVGMPPILLLPEITLVTVPLTREPAGSATLPSTVTSSNKRDSKVSPATAVLEDRSDDSCIVSVVPVGTVTRTGVCVFVPAVLVAREDVFDDAAWRVGLGFAAAAATASAR